MSINRQAVKISSNQKGFTLIELIIVIVILGILAVVAIPKYQNMKTDAEKGAANGVLGAAEGAAAITFSKNLISSGSVTPITDGTSLLDAMNPAPTGWTASGTTISDSTGTYTITISPIENDPTTPAGFTTNWP